MTFRKSWRDLPDVPTRCPVCSGNRTDAAAIAIHNLVAAQRGCRSYLDDKQGNDYIRNVGVSRIGND